MVIRVVEDKFFHAGGWTDMTKLKVAFRNFQNAPKKSKLCCSHKKILTTRRNRMVQSGILETSIKSEANIRTVQLNITIGAAKKS
jgi:hypothetical protein